MAWLDRLLRALGVEKQDAQVPSSLGSGGEAGETAETCNLREER